MRALREKLSAMNVVSRRNISVPNPSDENTGIVNQVKFSLKLTYLVFSTHWNKNPLFIQNSLDFDSSKM